MAKNRNRRGVYRVSWCPNSETTLSPVCKEAIVADAPCVRIRYRLTLNFNCV